MIDQIGSLSPKTPTRQIGAFEFGVRMRNLIKLTENDLKATRLQGFVLIIETLSTLGYGEGLDAFDKAIPNIKENKENG